MLAVEQWQLRSDLRSHNVTQDWRVIIAFIYPGWYFIPGTQIGTEVRLVILMTMSDQRQRIPFS